YAAEAYKSRAAATVSCAARGAAARSVSPSAAAKLERVRDIASSYFFRRSTLTRTVSRRDTVVAYFCSPRSGWRNTISCGPIGSDRLPIGVSPMRSPSIQTSAHGRAFIAMLAFGHSGLLAVVLPAGTWPVRDAR